MTTDTYRHGYGICKKHNRANIGLTGGPYCAECINWGRGPAASEPSSLRESLSVLSHNDLVDLAARQTEAMASAIQTLSYGSDGPCRKASGILCRALPEGVNAAGEVEHVR